MNARGAARWASRARTSRRPSGFVDRGNHSCAARPRRARRARCCASRGWRGSCAAAQAVLPFPIKGGKLYLYNNNPLLRQGYRGTTGIKTGYTDAAGPLPRGHRAARADRARRRAAALARSRHAGAQLLDRGFRASIASGVRPQRLARRSSSACRRPAPALVALGGARRRGRRRSASRGWRARDAAERARRRRRRAGRAAPRSPPSCRAAGGGSCPTAASSPTTARRRTRSSARSGSARRRRPARRLERQAQAATRAQARPGAARDGADRGRRRRPPGRGRPLQHAPARRRSSDRYLRAARKAKALLVLDIQPGPLGLLHRDARGCAALAASEPDVGLALDPEWRMAPGQVPGPGDRLASTRARSTRRRRWLSQLVTRDKLPQKLLLDPPVHRRHGRRQPQLQARAGARDGAQRRRLRRRRRSRSSSTRRSRAGRGASGEGFKLFYREDTNLMTPARRCCGCSRRPTSWSTSDARLPDPCLVVLVGRDRRRASRRGRARGSSADPSSPRTACARSSGAASATSARAATRSTARPDRREAPAPAG